MEIKKRYPRVFFTSSAIQKIVAEFNNAVKEPAKTAIRSLSINKGKEEWEYDTLDEFLSELKPEYEWARLTLSNPELNAFISMWQVDYGPPTNVSISSSSRERILRLRNVVDACADECFFAPPPKAKREQPKPKIFIGHGGSSQWRDLKDHLHELHGYDVIAYETGSRAGHTIRDIVGEMLELSSFAILVMTGEDPMEDGTVRARQNVIHEIGLFQGHLGFTRAIVLKEDGIEEFSNLAGVQQIRYSRGNIKETFGEVLAVLKREFAEDRQQ
jgi:hypothetical protein